MRRSSGIIGVLGVLAVTLGVLAPMASAQTGYPPGPCTVLVGTQDVGTVTIGQRFQVQLAPACVFTPGASVTVTVNGVNIPGKVATAGGFVVVTITAVSATQLSIDDPISVPARCGANTVVASGPSAVAGGQTVTQTATFTLLCPAVTPVVATPVQGRLSLTGANSLRFAAIALALMAVGSMFVISARRRRSGAAG